MTPLKDAFELRAAGREYRHGLARSSKGGALRHRSAGSGRPREASVFPGAVAQGSRQSVTASESLDTLQKVSWPKRKMTGAQLLAELPPGQEIVIAYPDGGDYLNREQLEWLRQQP